MSKSKIDLVNEDLQAESKREQSTWLRWKDKFKNIKVYVVLSAIYNNNLGMFWYALTGLLTSIERRYSFNSETTGRLLMAAEFGPLIVLLFVSHFANRYSMPRITAGLYVTFAAAVAMMTLPHYILKSDTKVNNATTQPLCIETNITSTEDDVGETIQSNTAAFGILYAALFLVGTAGAPAHTLQFSYLESNTKQTSSALYIALAGIGFSTAPILGLFLSAWATSLYVDLSDTHLVDSDPAWVGAWWLALVIVAACILLPTPLLCCLPRRMKDNINEKDIAVKSISNRKIYS